MILGRRRRRFLGGWSYLALLLSLTTTITVSRQHVSVLCFQLEAVGSRFPTKALSLSNLPQQKQASVTSSSSSSSSSPSNDGSSRSSSSLPEPRRLQARRKPQNPRPKFYWRDPNNLKQELRDFWKSLGMTIPSHEIPPVPSWVLLLYYERYDLQAAIASQGGQESIADILGGAPVIPGRWKDAVRKSKFIQELIALENNDLSPHVSPSAMKTRNEQQQVSEPPRWSHSSERKEKGYWNMQKVIQELYEYTDAYARNHGRPAVWMPRPSELLAEDRDDLRQALQRFGGAKKICTMAGMVPYREWHYFEGQLETMLELKRYLDEFEGSDYRNFPSLTRVQERGYDRLVALVRYYGGRRFLGARLGMNRMWVRNEEHDDDNNNVYYASWGRFDLVYGIRLLSWIRRQQAQQRPPLTTPCISMPTQQQMLLLPTGKENEQERRERLWLHQKTLESGGYDNVGRRLGLAV